MIEISELRRTFRGKIAALASPLTWEDFFRRRRSFRGVATHLNAATDWVLSAMDVADSKGIVAHYTIGVGWGEPSPEITGGLIPTLLALADRLDRQDLAQKALELARWLTSTQRPDGSFSGGRIGREPDELVFSTGQSIRGLVSAWQRTQDPLFLASAIRGGDWLCALKAEEETWRLQTNDALTAFALFRLGKKGGRPPFCSTAFRQYEWTLGKQRRNGFFQYAGFDGGDLPLSQSLAYVCEGLYRFSKESEDPRGIDACQRLMVTLEGMYGDESRLPGRLDRLLEPGASWSCVAGDLQFGWLALRIGKWTEDRKLKHWGKRLIQAAAATQRLDHPTPGIRGGIFGSCPVYGGFFPYSTVHWGAKYLLDALLELDV